MYIAQTAENGKYVRVAVVMDEYIKLYKKDAIYFVVKDTGIGIPKDQTDRIFERFYQVNKTRSKLQNGTGLGLSIVKHVVSYYKGSITVLSELGVGTTFTVMIPT